MTQLPASVLEQSPPGNLRRVLPHLKPLVTAVAALAADQYWLSKQSWYAELPGSGYAFIQKNLQESYSSSEDPGIIIIDVSKLIPSVEHELRTSGTTSDTTQLTKTNYDLLGYLLGTLSHLEPRAIAINWDVSGGVKGASIESAPANSTLQLSLKQAMDSVMARGIPVTYAANRTGDSPRVTALTSTTPSKPFAATSEIPDYAIAAYQAAGYKDPNADGLTPISAVLARGGRIDSLEKSESLRRYFGISTRPTIIPNSSDDSFWVNFEAVPSILGRSLQVNRLLTQVRLDPSIDEERKQLDRLRKPLKGKLVIIGDLREPTMTDRVSIPFSDKLLGTGGEFLNDTDLRTLAPKERHRIAVTRYRSALDSGSLFHAAATYTLMRAPLYSISAPQYDFIYALIWTYIWYTVSLSVIWFYSRIQRGACRESQARLMHFGIDIFVAIISIVALFPVASVLARQLSTIMPMVVAMGFAQLGEVFFVTLMALGGAKRGDT